MKALDPLLDGQFEAGAPQQLAGKDREPDLDLVVNDQKPVARLVGRQAKKFDVRGFQLFRVWDSLRAWQPRRAFPIWPPVPQMSCGRW
jgi:hypothetical protein